MRACIYDRGTGNMVGEIKLAPNGSAVLQTDNKYVREFINGLTVMDTTDIENPKELKPKDGAKYIQALEMYGPTIQLEA
jgi:hypothetical protein